VRGFAGKALFSGFYMNELLMRLLHRFDPHPELFHDYRVAVEALGHGRRTEAVLRVFEKQMLEAIGYGLVLDRDIDSGEPIHGEYAYRYQADRGPVSLGSGDGDGVPVAGETLLALAREHLDDERVLDEAKGLMRAVLRRYLGDRPLATRSLFRTGSHSQGAS
jgi:DNA repair protein RecO (recombination protein O)